MSSKKNKDGRLAKLIREPDPLANELQMILPPLLFSFVEAICKAHLEGSKQDHKSRDLIARFAFAMRAEAFAKFGHDTLETFALGKLLREGQFSYAERLGRLDSISHIKAYKNKGARLSGEQETAAEYIKSIWDAFGKFRTIGGRGFEGGSSRSSQVLQPLDVMGDELYNHYRQIYSPWADAAKYVIVARLRREGNVNIAAVIFKVLIEDFYPEQIDGAFGLPKGTGLRALKHGLSHYWSPERLAGWDKPSPKPMAAPGTAAAGGTGKEASAA